MVYANDQWVQLPTRDLYDTQMMAIAINAAKDMYEKGQQEIKDFNKLYGDFYTPIIGDQNKYNSTVIDPVKNVINAIYAAGGDPLRNPEARALISKTINSINTGDVAKWRQRAENARAWYKNMAELRSKGLYNEDFSEFLKERPDLWDENSMGFTSPTAYDDLNAHTSHWFDKLDKNQYLRTEGMYDIHGVKPEDLNSVMDQMMPDFINSDYGRYQMELAKRQLGPNATVADVVDQLRKNIVYANKELTLQTRSINELAKLELQDKYNAKNAARDFYYKKELFKYQHPELFDEDGNRLPNQLNSGPTPWNIQKESQMVGNFNNRMGIITNGQQSAIYDPKKFTSAINSIVNSLTSRLQNLKEKYSTKVEDGFEEKTLTKREYVPGIGPGMPGRYVTREIKQKVPKYKTITSSQYDQKSKRLQNKIDAYKKILSGDFSQFNFNQFREDFKNLAYSTKGAKTNEELMQQADKFWSMFEVDAVDNEDKERQRNAFAGTSATSEIPQLSGKYRQVSFERMNLNYTPMRRVNIAGSTRFATEEEAKRLRKATPFQTTFDKWLKQSGVTGYMIDDDVAHAVIPTSRGVQHDFAGKVSITAADFDRFYESIPKQDKVGWSKNEIARQLGLVPRDRTGKRYDSSIGGWNSITYYDVPMTYTMSDPYEISQMNKKYTKDLFGSAKAYDISVTDEAAGFK